MARRLKTVALQIAPVSDAELDTFIAKIGQAQGRIDELTAIAEQEKAAIDERLAGATGADKEYVKSATAGVTAYVEANRARLTPRDKKTITLTSGVIEYRAGRLSIAVKGKDAVIAGLEEMGCFEFVTVSKSINKEALLALVRVKGVEALPNVAGLSVKQGGETIEIKPNQITEDIG